MLNLTQRVAHERLTRICFIDYDRQMALVAERKDPATGQCGIAGVGRLTKSHGANEAECATLVSDRFQGQGLGTELVRRLIEVGRCEKLSRITADILTDNRVMQRICKKLGFRLTHSVEDELVKAELVFD